MTPVIVELAAFATMPATAPTSKPELVEDEVTSLWWDETPTPNICEETPKRAGFSVTRRLRTDMRDPNSFDPHS